LRVHIYECILYIMRTLGNLHYVAGVAETFRESIIDQHFDRYTEIIIRVHEHRGAKNDNL